MTDFKPGDKVRCIDDTRQHMPVTVELGKIYTVVALAWGNTVQFVETNDYKFRTSRFELVASGPAPSLIDQALAQAKAEPTKPAYEPESFVGKAIDWSKLIKDAST